MTRMRALPLRGLLRESGQRPNEQSVCSAHSRRLKCSRLPFECPYLFGASTKPEPGFSPMTHQS